MAAASKGHTQGVRVWGWGSFELKTRPLPLVLTCDRLDFNEATWTPCDVLWRKARRRGEEGGGRDERGEGGSSAHSGGFTMLLLHR